MPITVPSSNFPHKSPNPFPLSIPYLTMSLKNGKHSATCVEESIILLIAQPAAFPASEAFDAINDALKSSDAERKSAMKQGNAVFAFTLKNKAGETESWHIDLKEKGEVAKGLGAKPTGE